MPKSVSFFSKNPPTSTLVHGNKAKLKRPSLALLRCKMTFEILKLGLIALQNHFQIFELGLIAVQNEFDFAKF